LEFPNQLPEELIPRDTIGVVVGNGLGRFAVAISTGGTTTTLDGRIGDVPIPGAGAFAGPHGAVCATGWGEVIIRENLSRRVYEFMAAGDSPASPSARGSNFSRPISASASLPSPADGLRGLGQHDDGLGGYRARRGRQRTPVTTRPLRIARSAYPGQG
jgi:hypothetical protein